MPGPLQLGRIVWAETADTNGVRKLRPAIVVTSSDRITPAAPLDVVAVTSRLPEPLPNDHVLLPWHAQGHPRTRLNRKCAAVCTWMARISPDDRKPSVTRQLPHGAVYDRIPIGHHDHSTLTGDAGSGYR